MRDERGLSTTEVLISTAIVVMMVGTTVIGGFGRISSASTAREASLLVDQIGIARARAQLQNEKWMLHFPAASGSDFVTHYDIYTCGGATANSATAYVYCGTNLADWFKYETVTPRGVGFRLPSAAPLSLIFEARGKFTPLSTDATVTVCIRVRKPDGTDGCSVTDTAKTLNIEKSTGLVQVSP